MNKHQRDELISLLLLLPIADTHAGRSMLLDGVPGGEYFNRDPGNKYTDLCLIVNQTRKSGGGHTGTIIGNALAVAEGTEAWESLERILREIRSPKSAPPTPDIVRKQKNKNDAEKPRVFLSYARADSAMAEKIYADLEREGINVWMDTKDLLPGQKWKTVISRAIKESSYFLALFSSHSVSKKGFFQSELKRAVKVLEELPEYDIYFIPARLDDCEPEDETLAEFHWADLFPDYRAGLDLILKVLKARTREFGQTAGADRKAGGKMVKRRVRRDPIRISDTEARGNFGLDSKWRPLAYVDNKYEDNGNETITDHATGLMWQKSGSDWLPFEKAEAYIQIVNSRQVAGYSDWRLPTIPELMSLMEPNEKNGDLYIHTIFDPKQRYCLSSDMRLPDGAWCVIFYYGIVYWNSLFDVYVRAVRSGQ